MLRLPYVAILRDGVPLASAGTPLPTRGSWPLADGAELVAAPRHGTPSLDERDRAVLTAMAQLVSGSVQAEVLAADLHGARQRLVVAREEERRRLRRDLHDGLGPLLTGLGLNLDAARATNDPDQAALYLGNAKEASSQVIVSLREVVHGLRPPVLDELGLLGALRLQCDRLARAGSLSVDIVAEEVALPAAVEVAVFRTVVEAVTNVVRHSDARTVRVLVESSADTLTVDVLDDGSASGEWRPGVGLRSMRERAEELGGTFSAGGGLVHLGLPLGRIGS